MLSNVVLTKYQFNQSSTYLFELNFTPTRCLTCIRWWYR